MFHTLDLLSGQQVPKSCYIECMSSKKNKFIVGIMVTCWVNYLISDNTCIILFMNKIKLLNYDECLNVTGVIFWIE